MNTAYTVTFPTIQPTLGPVTAIFCEDTVTEEYLEIFDGLYPDTECVNYTFSEILNADNIAWIGSIIDLSGTLVVDLTDVTSEIVLMVMSAELTQNKTVYWIASYENRETTLIVARVCKNVFDSAMALDQFLVGNED